MALQLQVTALTGFLAHQGRGAGGLSTQRNWAASGQRGRPRLDSRSLCRMLRNPSQKDTRLPLAQNFAHDFTGPVHTPA